MLRFFAKCLSKDWKNNERVFQYQELLYILEIICFKLIIGHYNDPVIAYFRMNKIQELNTRKYYCQPSATM